jgi:hypothetical protein
VSRISERRGQPNILAFTLVDDAEQSAQRHPPLISDLTQILPKLSSSAKLVGRSSIGWDKCRLSCCLIERFRACSSNWGIFRYLERIPWRLMKSGQTSSDVQARIGAVVSTLAPRKRRGQSGKDGQQLTADWVVNDAHATSKCQRVSLCRSG